MKKKLIAAALATLMTLALASCGEAASSTTPFVTTPAETDPMTTPGETDLITTPVGTAPATPVDVYEAFTAETFEASDGTVLPYRFYLPADYSEDQAYPVLIFLHGAGERGTDNALQLKNAVQNLFNDTASPIYQSIVIAPQCPENNQWVDTPWVEGNYSTNQVAFSNELEAVIELLDTVLDGYSTDFNRVYAMGLSMGGFGTWDLLTRFSAYFAAGIPVCGGGDPYYIDALIDMPIYTFHGDQDSAVPVAGTREMVQALKTAGSTKIVYEELAGYDHNVWDYASTKEGLMEWLFAQTREDGR